MKSRATRLAEIDELINITTVDGNPLPTEGCYEAAVWLDGQWRTGAFFVLPGLTSEMLLGIDFINTHYLDYNSRARKVVAQDSYRKIKTRRETRIPAGSRQLVKVRCGALEVQEGEMIIASIGSHQVPVAGAETIITGKGQEYEVYIDNVLDVELVIPRGTEVGALEAVPEKECKKLDLKEDQVPTEKGPPSQRCDPEKERMLREVIGDQMKNLGEETGNLYLQAILENHDIFSRDKSDLGRTTVMEHTIKLKDEEPAYNKQFRIPEEHRSILIEHLQNWLRLGVVSPCKSHWNSPIFLVPKKDGTMRPVLDFREVNKKSMVDKYSAREVSDCIDEIGRNGSTVFSSLDLTAGFWQLPLQKESRPYTAFTIPGLGSFSWNCTPMGLLGSPATFGRMMDFIMRFLQVIAYQDDLLVHSKSHKEQVEILTRCFARLRANGLKLNAKKCAFGQPEIPYLGYTLTARGILPGKDKTEAIRSSQAPRTPRQVREFTGLCNYFRASIKDFAKLAAPLNKLLAKDAKWRRGELPEEAQEAYEQLKEALTNPPVLAYPNPNLDYHLVVDASLGLQGAPGGLGASLIQIDEQGVPRAVGFASRGLSKFEKNYTSYLAELTACVFGIEYFQVYLKGRHFFLYTDHRPMEKLSSTHTRTLNRLQQLMSEYSFTIRYKPGKENEVADFLSRNPIASIDLAGKDLQELQREDELISKILETWDDEQAPEALKRLRKRLIRDKGILFFAKPDGGRATFAPKVIQPEILRAAHNSLLGGHMGVFKSRERILGRYFWPSLQQDVTEHVKGCVGCQKIKPWNRPNRAPLKPLEQPASPNHRIHIDLFGPLATSGQGKKMVCVITDAFTKYTELVALRSKEAQEVAKAIMDTWITRYSTPKEIVTDGGKEFANKLLGALCQELGILHRQTTPYHPETNASAEVFNRTMKHYLAAALEQPYLDWEELLPALRICYNTSVSKATRATPFSLVYGMEANMPFFDLEKAISLDEKYPEMLAHLKAMRLKAAEVNLQYRKAYKKYYDKAKKTERQSLKPGDQILVENTHKVGANPKFHPAFLGPFTVTRVEDLNIFYMDKRKEKVAHMNRVKAVKLANSASAGKPLNQAAEALGVPGLSHQQGPGMQTQGQQNLGMQGPSQRASNSASSGNASALPSQGSGSHFTPGLLHQQGPGMQTPSQQGLGMQSRSQQLPGSPSQHIPEVQDNGSSGTQEQQIPQTMSQQFWEVQSQHNSGMQEHEEGEDQTKQGSCSQEDYLTPLPDSPLPPTPAFWRYRTQQKRASISESSEESQGDEERASISESSEESQGQEERTLLGGERASLCEERASMTEGAQGERMDTGECSHVFHNEVTMDDSRKRKPESPLAQEKKRAAVVIVPLSTNLRSHGLQQGDRSLPDRPREYKSYTRKTCAPSTEEQSS